MNTKNLTLDKLSDCTNRSYGQTLFLYELLDRDLKKLVLLEQKLKNNFLSYCPDDRDECEKVLLMGDGSGWVFADERYSHLDDFLSDEDKFGKECIFIPTGHKGRINKELGYTKDRLNRHHGKPLFPAQWGIYWYSGSEGKEHADRIRSLGMPNFWQDKNKIYFQR